MSNVVQRLAERIAQAKRIGFQVRSELLDGAPATWCVLGSQKVIFLDLSHSASEQLLQLNEVLESYRLETSLEASDSALAGQKHAA